MSHWGSVQLDLNDDVSFRDTVSIVQHPEGGSKSIAVGTNQVLGIHGVTLHYLTDTLPGSSGSPVFNDEWRVVAMHQRSDVVPCTLHGGLRYANAGILLSAIRGDIGPDWLPEQALP